jgi:DNA-binding NarL/FixJ family response regulator
VDGYVLRDAPFDELIAALRSAVRGKLYLSADLFGDLVQSLVSDREASAPKSKWELLTARERVVLKLVAEGRTNRQVGQYLNLSHKTIEKYRANAMRKLQVGTLPDLVLAAIDMGLIEPTTGRPRALDQGGQATHLPFDGEATKAPPSTSSPLSIAEYREKVARGT